MIWLKKTFPRYGADWAADQDRFSNLMFGVAAQGTDAYRRMLMVAVEESAAYPKTEDVFLRLPDSSFATLFPGYEPAASPPTRVETLLVGDQLEFERLFRAAT